MMRGLGFDKPLIEYNPDLSSVAKDASPASFGHSLAIPAKACSTFTWADPRKRFALYLFL